MLAYSHPSCALNALDSIGEQNTSQIRIWTEAFPVASAFWTATQWSGDRSEEGVDALVAELFAHRHTSSKRKTSAP